MSNSIILSSCLFGSVYLMCKSLELINKSLLDNKKIPHELILFNGLTFMVAGSIYIGSFTMLTISYYKYLYLK